MALPVGVGDVLLLLLLLARVPGRRGVVRLLLVVLLGLLRLPDGLGPAGLESTRKAPLVALEASGHASHHAALEAARQRVVLHRRRHVSLEVALDIPLLLEAVGLEAVLELEATRIAGAQLLALVADEVVVEELVVVGARLVAHQAPV